MTEPTDAEIEAAWTDATGSSILPYPDDMLAFARAVLAKWGTPAPVGVEPVAWRVRRLDSPNYWIIFLHKPVDALMDPKREVQPLYTSPQPTQAQAGAVPLTKEQAASLCKMGPVYAPDGQVVRTPEQYRRELEGAKLAGIRTAERAHGIGIKGGQHGAE